MANLTPAFNLCLKERGAKPVSDKQFNLDKIDSFLQEAYSVVRLPSLIPPQNSS